jgi:hypothetical protein
VGNSGQICFGMSEPQCWDHLGHDQHPDVKLLMLLRDLTQCPILYVLIRSVTLMNSSRYLRRALDLSKLRRVSCRQREWWGKEPTGTPCEGASYERCYSIRE